MYHLSHHSISEPHTDRLDMKFLFFPLS
jgi:hypothetical protein